MLSAKASSASDSKLFWMSLNFVSQLIFLSHIRFVCRVYYFTKLHCFLTTRMFDWTHKLIREKPILHFLPLPSFESRRLEIFKIHTETHIIKAPKKSKFLLTYWHHPVLVMCQTVRAHEVKPFEEVHFSPNFCLPGVTGAHLEFCLIKRNVPARRACNRIFPLWNLAFL